LGAPAATFFGGLLVFVVTLITVWRVPEIPRFRWRETKDQQADRATEDERATG
jgi:hypothetical protein